LYLTIDNLLILLGFGAFCVYVLASIRIREIAVDAVVKASKRDDYQLLDQSVHLRKMSLSRDQEGRWRLWREYRFDYSIEGADRRQGHVIMLGKRLQAIVVGDLPHTLH
jgi:hypothetical protein